jgi:hypothetical protein
VPYCRYTTGQGFTVAQSIKLQRFSYPIDQELSYPDRATHNHLLPQKVSKDQTFLGSGFDTDSTSTYPRPTIKPAMVPRRNVSRNRQGCYSGLFKSPSQSYYSNDAFRNSLRYHDFCGCYPKAFTTSLTDMRFVHQAGCQTPPIM